ncbi:DUF551 domain-containing protein [Escherichia coli]|nr:DUF551 domain-containing protein [Escherichia coli]HAG7206623.1 DUF551 domain-containing protein [Escherichia coli]
MAELTKEWLKQTIAEYEANRDELPFGLDTNSAIELQAFKLALASLEAEPVAYIIQDSDARSRGEKGILRYFANISDEDINEYEITVTPLYAAPPETVSVPDAMEMDDDFDSAFEHGKAVGWNACRAAMLQGADVSLTHEGKNHHEDKLGMVNHLGDVTEKVEPVTQIEPVADLYGLTSPTGGETSFTFDAVEARDFIDGGWSCQEYVELERFQEAVSGNSPVIQDGWISCSERMPNDKQYVWCWGKSYGWTEYDTFEGYYDWSRNKWWAVTDDGEEPASKVTHWMPLPEPPQEVNRG